MAADSSEDAMKIQEAWNNSREIIRNENDLINQRMTAFLTFQGFLFTGSAILVTNAFGKESPIPRLTVTMLIMMLVGSFVGFLISYRTQIHIRAAARHIEATSKWWTAFRKDAEFRKNLPFPIIIGTIGKPPLTPWGMKRSLRRLDSSHRIAVRSHYEKLLNSPLLSNDKEEEILYPSSNIVGSLPLVLMHVWGWSFAISLGVLILIFYMHTDILLDILLSLGGK